MKILINPEWLSLVKDLKIKQKAELLICLLSYPNGKSELGAWDFMKKQIDRDAEKYQARCRNLKENRQKRWPNKQNDNRNETDEAQIDDTQTADDPQQNPISVSNSKSIESEKINEKEKSIENRNTVAGLLKNMTQNMRMDAPMRYEITSDFDFDKISERDSVFRETFCDGRYKDTVLIKAQRSLHSKRYGQRLTLQQLIDWVEQEGKF